MSLTNTATPEYCGNDYCCGRLAIDPSLADDYGHNVPRCIICNKTFEQGQARMDEVREYNRLHPRPVSESHLITPVVIKPKLKEENVAAKTEFKCPDCGNISGRAIDLGRHRHFIHGYTSPRKVSKPVAKLPKIIPEIIPAQAQKEKPAAPIVVVRAHDTPVKPIPPPVHVAPAQPAPSAPALPPLPVFSRWWFPSVQLKWLETYRELVGK